MYTRYYLKLNGPVRLSEPVSYLNADPPYTQRCPGEPIWAKVTRNQAYKISFVKFNQWNFFIQLICRTKRRVQLCMRYTPVIRYIPDGGYAINTPITHLPGKILGYFCLKNKIERDDNQNEGLESNSYRKRQKLYPNRKSELKEKDTPVNLPSRFPNPISPNFGRFPIFGIFPEDENSFSRNSNFVLKSLKKCFSFSL